MNVDVIVMFVATLPKEYHSIIKVFTDISTNCNMDEQIEYNKFSTADYFHHHK